MCCANATINIETIGGSAGSHHIRSEFVENIGRHVVCRTVGAVDINAHALQIDFLADRRLAEFNVAT